MTGPSPGSLEQILWNMSPVTQTLDVPQRRVLRGLMASPSGRDRPVATSLVQAQRAVALDENSSSRIGVPEYAGQRHIR